MKTHISVTGHESVSFVTRVTKVTASLGGKPGDLTTQPISFSANGRVRGALLIRFAARKNPNRPSWL